jgi:hypothetical protein
MRGPQYAGLGWAGLGWGSGVCLVLVVGARRAPLVAHLVLHTWAGCAPPAATPLVAVSTREIMYWPTLRNMPLWTLAQELSPDCNYNVASARNWLAWGLARSPFFLLLFNSFLEFWIGYFPKDAFNARDLTKCPEVNKIFGIEVEPRFCTPTNVDGQQDDTTGDEYKAK